MDNQDNQIQEADIVEDASASSAQDQSAEEPKAASTEGSSEPKEEAQTFNNSGDATVLLSLEQMIKSHISRIDRLSEEARKHKEMVDSAFENSETYRQHLEAAKEATRVKNTTRQEILKQPAMVVLSNKLKGLQTELKEAQQELLDYLPEYMRLSGSNQIEGEDGEVRQIIMVPKLVKAFTANPKK